MPDWLEPLARIMQIATGISAVAIAIIVHRHNRTRDKESLRERSWHSQQQINLTCASNDQMMEAAEKFICENFVLDAEAAEFKRAAYIVFMYLNRIRLMWSGWKSGVISKNDMLDDVRPTISLFRNNPIIVRYCLTRGYSKEFSDFIIHAMSHSDHGGRTFLSAEEFLSDIKTHMKESDVHYSL